jgi:hypothetical protein
MIKKYIKLLLISLIVSLLSIQCAIAAKSPEGLWLATSPFYYDRPIAIVKIYVKNNVLYGEIVKIIPLNESMKGATVANSGPVMMYGYHEKNGKWVDGKIYEQISAKTHSSSLEISDDGNHLYVRGWKGPFFRTARWDRVK